MNTKQIAERSTKLIILFSLVLTFSCLEKKQTNDVPLKNKTLDDLVEVDDNFGDLVIVDSLGVTGADGVISFPLNDTISIFMMGDSFLSKVVDRKRDVDSRMINNTFILVNEKQGSHTALYNGTLEDADSPLHLVLGCTTFRGLAGALYSAITTLENGLGKIDNYSLGLFHGTIVAYISKDIH